VVRLCSLMICEGLYADGDELRILAPATEGAEVQRGVRPVARRCGAG
jgi:hypothetical protein